MDRNDRRNCQVRLLGQSGMPVGCGFVCDERVVMTCTHVVETCLGGSVDNGAIVECRVGGSPGHPATLRVVKSYPTIIDEAAQSYHLRDIAVLELEPTSTFPNESLPVSSKLSSVDTGMELIGTGIKEGFLKGIQFSGIIGESPDPSRVYVTARHQDLVMAPGCSGAATFHQHDGFAGMVVEVQQSATGFIIPIEILRKVWPIRSGIKSSLPAPEAPFAPPATTEPLNRRLLRALGNFDRNPQTADFMRAFDRKWGQHRMAMLCAIAGLKDDVPQHCRDKFRKHDLVDFFRRNSIALNKVDAVEITWPQSERAFDVGLVFERMKGELAENLKAPGSNPAQIREALNNHLGQLVFYSKLDQRTLSRSNFELGDLPQLIFNPFGRRNYSKDQLELLNKWARYFCEIDDEAIDRPLIHFLIITLNEKDFRLGHEEPNALLNSFYEDLLEATNRELEPHSSIEATSLLGHFEIDFIDTWIEANADRIGLDERQVEEIRDNARQKFTDQSCIRLKDVENWMRSVAG